MADLDRDGTPDIVIGSTWFETIREGGQVRWQAHGFAEFHCNATVAVADFNGDGRPDVALAPSELAGQRSRLSWFEAPADPRASPWREHVLADPIEAVVHSLAAADFEHDGRMDIAFAEMHKGADPDEVGIFLNRGAGHAWEKVVASTTGSHGLQILDADGDGAPDLFGANWSGPRQTVELWRQRTRPAAEASRDGNDATAFSGLPALRVSENRRFLVTAEGQPFFWLADTAWWIRQLPPPLVKHYLSTRAQQGFNVIQVHSGLAVTNHAGDSPFLNNSPESPNELLVRFFGRLRAHVRAQRCLRVLQPGVSGAGTFPPDASQRPGPAGRVARGVAGAGRHADAAPAPTDRIASLSHAGPGPVAAGDPGDEPAWASGGVARRGLRLGLRADRETLPGVAGQAERPRSPGLVVRSAHR